MTTSRVGIGLVFTQVRRQPLHLLGDPSSLDRHHLGEKSLCSLGRISPKVALAGFGPHQLACASQTKPLGCRLVSL